MKNAGPPSLPGKKAMPPPSAKKTGVSWSPCVHAPARECKPVATATIDRAPVGRDQDPQCLLQGKRALQKWCPARKVRSTIETLYITSCSTPQPPVCGIRETRGMVRHGTAGGGEPTVSCFCVHAYVFRSVLSDLPRASRDARFKEKEGRKGSPRHARQAHEVAEDCRYPPWS